MKFLKDFAFTVAIFYAGGVVATASIALPMYRGAFFDVGPSVMTHALLWPTLVYAAILS